ncbi:MAG: hypothetical protein LBU60_00960 [Clostridiales bacterium]|jgi:hypothetical protein|nr:hypothetical protein [Clostridiales bacterium]
MRVLSNRKKLVASLVAFVVITTLLFSSPKSLAWARTFDFGPRGTSRGHISRAVIDPLMSSVEVQKRVKFGGSFNVEVVSGLDIKLMSPSGMDVSSQIDSNGEIVASEVGHYNLIYSDPVSGSQYRDFSILSYVEDDLILEVENDGASIPSIAPRSPENGEKYWVELPQATVVSYDDFGTRSNILGTEDDLFSNLLDGSKLGNFDDTRNNYVIVDVRRGGMSGQSNNSEVVTLQGEGTREKPFRFPTDDQNITYFIRYSFFSTDTGRAAPLLTKDYKVSLQNRFDNTSTPRLQVSAPSNTGNLNTQVQLPKASGSDVYEGNDIRIVVTVIDPSGSPVKEIDKNDPIQFDKKTGWATGVIGEKAKPVYFDNGQNMSFYPTLTGDYQVTYQAFSSRFSDTTPVVINGVEYTRLNPSQQHRFTVTVIDGLSPVVQRIDDYMIPSQWGATVSLLATDSNGNFIQQPNSSRYQTVQLTDSTLYFPGPKLEGQKEGDPYFEDRMEIVDNVSKLRVTEGDTANSVIRVEATLINPQGTDIWRFNDLFGNPEQQNLGEKVGVTDGGLVFNSQSVFKDGFNFAEYSSFANAQQVDFAGVYTLEYKFIDAAGRTTTRRYSIDVSSNFVDNSPAHASLPVVESFLVADETLEYWIPTPTVSSVNHERPKMEYTLKVNDGDGVDQSGQTTQKFDLKGIERLVWIDDKVYLTEYQSDDLAREFGNIVDLTTGAKNGIATLQFSLKATSLTGNTSLASPDTDSLTVGSIARSVSVVTELFNNKEINDKLDIVSHLNLDATFTQGQQVNLGGAVVASGLTEQDREFIGFEISIHSLERYTGSTSGNGITGPDYVLNEFPELLTNGMSVDSWWSYDSASDTYSLNVGNISFLSTSSGEHTITIRAFTARGINTIDVGYFSVDRTNGGGAIPKSNSSSVGRSASSYERSNQIVPSSMDLFSSVSLPSWSFPSESKNAHTRRRITGGPFELMGNTFTPRVEGTFLYEQRAFNRGVDGSNNQWLGDSFLSTDNADWNNGDTMDDGLHNIQVSDSDENVIFSVSGNRGFVMHLDIASDQNDIYVLPNVVAFNSGRNFNVSQPEITVGGVRVETFRTDDLPSDHPIFTDEDHPMYGQTGWYFVPVENGEYTITYTATQGNVSAEQSYSIWVGRTNSPEFSIDENKSISGRNYSRTITRSFDTNFVFDMIYLEDLIGITPDPNGNVNQEDSRVATQIRDRGLNFRKELIDPNGNVVGESTDRLSQGIGWNLNASGHWTVRYTVTDNVGLVTVISDTIIVLPKSSSGGIPLATISTILIVVAIVLILGAFVYLIRFKKVKVPTTTHKN